MLLALLSVVSCILFFFKQKTAYEMRISDWSSDVCSSDLVPLHTFGVGPVHGQTGEELGRHAATPAGVVVRAAAARPGGLRFAQFLEQRRFLPDVDRKSVV